MPRESTARAGRVQPAPDPKDAEKGGQRTRASIAPSDGTSWMDLNFVRGLIEAVDQSSIDTLDMYREGLRIRISKSPPPARVLTNGAAHASPAAVTPVAAVPVTAPEPVTEAPPMRKLTDVKSPMVGTFYRAPAPEAPPYIEVGSTVRKGQTLCILEAMKLMNELPSEVDGIVREILAENADPVEYGQVLFRIEPHGSA
ncbi:MAG: acetyl-CoA carboxylase biotin carboxyl carrier protein [Longimicrobiales bacterium]